MDGSLTTWFNGSPVITVDSTGDLGTWYNGTVFTYLEKIIESGAVVNYGAVLLMMMM